MAKQTDLNMTEINEKLKELRDEQLRIVILLMSTGKSFQEAYEVAKTFGVPAAS